MDDNPQTAIKEARTKLHWLLTDMGKHYVQLPVREDNFINSNTYSIECEGLAAVGRRRIGRSDRELAPFETCCIQILERVGIVVETVFTLQSLEYMLW